MLLQRCLKRRKDKSVDIIHQKPYEAIIQLEWYAAFIVLV